MILSGDIASRIGVREAMSRLVNEGLLERGKNGGFVVRKFGFRDVIDAIELRGLLEGAAARQAAERRPTPEQAARLPDLGSKLPWALRSKRSLLALKRSSCSRFDARQDPASATSVRPRMRFPKADCSGGEMLL